MYTLPLCITDYRPLKQSAEINMFTKVTYFIATPVKEVESTYATNSMV